MNLLIILFQNDVNISNLYKKIKISELEKYIESIKQLENIAILYLLFM